MLTALQMLTMLSAPRSMPIICTASSMPRALVPIAPGSEELEATAIVNVLRRAGWSVTLASVGVPGMDPVSCARNQLLVPDAAIDSPDILDSDYDAILLPGGMPGASNLAASSPLLDRLRRQAAEKKWYGAICAAPAVVFAGAAADLLPRQATCHPAFTEKLEAAGCDVNRLLDRVVVDDDRGCVTSRGPGTAIEFALKVVELVQGSEVAEATGGPMVLP